MNAEDFFVLSWLFGPGFLAKKPGESMGVEVIAGGPSPERQAQDDNV